MLSSGCELPRDESKVRKGVVISAASALLLTAACANPFAGPAKKCDEGDKVCATAVRISNRVAAELQNPDNSKNSQISATRTNDANWTMERLVGNRLYRLHVSLGTLEALKDKRVTQDEVGMVSCEKRAWIPEENDSVTIVYSALDKINGEWVTESDPVLNTEANLCTTVYKQFVELD